MPFHCFSHLGPAAEKQVSILKNQKLNGFSSFPLEEAKLLKIHIQISLKVEVRRQKPNF